MEGHSLGRFLRLYNSMVGFLRTDRVSGLLDMAWKVMEGHNWVQFLHWYNSTVGLHHLDNLPEWGQM